MQPEESTGKLQEVWQICRQLRKVPMVLPSCATVSIMLQYPLNGLALPRKTSMTTRKMSLCEIGYPKTPMVENVIFLDLKWS